jgi:hypothetical protein
MSFWSYIIFMASVFINVTVASFYPFQDELPSKKPIYFKIIIFLVLIKTISRFWTSLVWPYLGLSAGLSGNCHRYSNSNGNQKLDFLIYSSDDCLTWSGIYFDTLGLINSK